MINNELQEVVKNLFDRQWDANIDNDEEDERLQTIYDNTVAKYGWENTFESIDDYMRTKCLDGESVFNFINACNNSFGSFFNLSISSLSSSVKTLFFKS